MDLRSKRLATRYSPILLAAVVISVIAPRLNVIYSASIRPTLGWVSNSPAQPGDYVLFPLLHPYLADGKSSRKITKLYRCGPGDVLKSEHHRFYCNGVYLGIAKTETPSGKPLDVFTWDGPIPPGKAFLLGEHPDSLDSRYWGFMDIDKLQRVVPIL